MDRFARFDRHSDVQASLDLFALSLEKVDTDPLAWKWAVKSIHNALQGYLCCSLCRGNSFQSWPDSGVKKWLEAVNLGKPPPYVKLDIFVNLYDKAFTNSNHIDREQILSLHERRNAFAHFNVDGLSLDTIGTFTACREAYKAIKHLVERPGSPFFYEEHQEAQFLASASLIDHLLQLLKPQIEALARK